MTQFVNSSDVSPKPGQHPFAQGTPGFPPNGVTGPYTFAQGAPGFPPNGTTGPQPFVQGAPGFPPNGVTGPNLLARNVPGMSAGGTTEQQRVLVPVPPTPEIPTGGTTGQITKVISERRTGRRQWRLFEIALTIVVDALLAYVAFRFAYYLRYHILLNSDLIASIRINVLGGHAREDVITSLNEFRGLEIGVILGVPAIFILRGMYSLRLSGTLFTQLWRILTSLTLGLSVLIAFYFFFQGASNSRLLVPFIWVSAVVILSLGRMMLSMLMGTLHRLGLGETRVLVVGSGRLGKMIMQHIVASPHLGFSIVGFLHEAQEQLPGDFGRFKLLGSLEDLALVIRSMQVDEVIIALPSELHQQAIRSVRLCERLGASFKLVPELYELSLSRIDMEAVEGIPLLGIKQQPLNRVQRALVRATDIVGAVLVLLLGSPLWLCFALLIKATSAGPVILRQTRVGLDGHLFTCYKFRSMYKDAEQRLASLLDKNEAQGPLFKMHDDPRVTSVGKFLRKTSLDEIPQLFNAIKGDMSLVGPRPPLPREVAQYEEWQKGRLAMKPGMTGLWQVRGRSDLSFDEGVLMDLYYIENWSLRLYYHILWRTVPTVLFRRGAY
jgi:exopolysaccharide biosynthesis polyprenyl glycosylphosphotransferase